VQCVGREGEEVVVAAVEDILAELGCVGVVGGVCDSKESEVCMKWLEELDRG